MNRCNECGTELRDEGRFAHGCPVCAIRGALDLGDLNGVLNGARPNAGISGGDSGDLEWMEEIGRGGMGVVYKARQRSLDRTVAVKMILAGPMADPDSVARFRSEAAAVAQLRHPNIVAIHEVGRSTAGEYFVMDWIEGRSLDAMVRDDKPDSRHAASLLRILAGAIAYAHQNGVVHRDLKPSNILLGADGQPRITDFGLARRLDAPSDLTLTGHPLGSPGYLPPEQAVGDKARIGPASDIYALGGILYHMLVGRTPFTGATPEMIIEQVLNRDPVSPRRLDPGVPRDLETICLNCLEKDPDRRYSSAAALEADLGRFLENQPIAARPTAAWEQGWKWCRRRPAVASLSVGVLVLLMALMIGSWIATWRLSAARTRELRESYVSKITLADRLIRDGDLGEALEVLLRCPSEHRGWEWGRLVYLCHHEVFAARTHAGPVRSVALDRYGKRLTTVGTNGVTRVWDVLSGQEIADSQAPTGATVSTASGGSQLHHPVTGTRSFMDDAPEGLIASSPDGAKWVVHDAAGGIALMDRTTGEREAGFPMALTEVRSVEWDPMARSLLIVEENGTAWWWNPGHPNGWKRLNVAHDRGVFSADGRFLATVSSMSRLTVWNAHTGEVALDLGHQKAPVLQVTFSGDGKWIAYAHPDGSVRVRRIDPGRARVRGDSWVTHATFSADGLSLATTHSDRFIRIRDVASGQLRAALPVPFPFVSHAAFDPTGRLLVSTCLDRRLRILDIDTKSLLSSEPGHEAPVMRVVWSPDGQWIASGDLDGQVILWRHLGEGRIQRLWAISCGAMIWSLAFSPDSRHLAIASGADQANIQGPAQVWRPSEAGDREQPTDRIQVRSVGSSREELSLSGHRAAVVWVSYSPDGTRIVSASDDHTVRVWDAATGKEEWKVRTESFPWAAPFSPDGQRIAVPCSELTTARRLPYVEILEASTGRPMLRLDGLTDQIWTAAFGPEGLRLVTCGTDQSMRFWEAFPWTEAELTLNGRPDLRAWLRDRSRDYWRRRIAAESAPRATPDPPPSVAPGRLDRLYWPARADTIPEACVDLTEHYNAALDVAWVPPNAGSAYFRNHLRELPEGHQKFGGIDFDVRGVVQLASGIPESLPMPGSWDRFPLEIRDIAVGRRGERLHLLHGTVGSDMINRARWPPPADGTPIGKLIVQYAAGRAELPILYGAHVRDWWVAMDPDPRVSEAEIAWEGSNPSAAHYGTSIRLYQATWRNPRPHSVIESITYANGDTHEAPFLVAITVE